MFAPSMAIPRTRVAGSSRLALKVATVVAQLALVVAFGIAATVLLGLAMASPVVVPLAQRQGDVLSAADVATAQQLGSLWWLYGTGTLLSLGAALATIGNLMQRLAAPSHG